MIKAVAQTVVNDVYGAAEIAELTRREAMTAVTAVLVALQGGSAPSFPISFKNWYVSPNVLGTAAGAGTKEDPFSLEYACRGAPVNILGEPTTGTGILRILPGHRVLLRGGVYNPLDIVNEGLRDSGFNVAISGTDDLPIGWMSAPGETAEICGTIREVEGAANATAWTLRTDTAGNQTWKSNFIVPGTSHLVGGNIEIANKKYPLGRLRFNEVAAIDTDTVLWQNTSTYYAGPSVVRTADKKVVIRLDMPPSEIFFGRSIATPPSRDPRASKIQLYKSSTITMRVTGNHHIFDGLKFGTGGDRMLHILGSGVTVRRCKFPYVGYLGISGGEVGNVNWRIEDCLFDGCMHKDWWVSYADIKGGSEMLSYNRAHLASFGGAAFGKVVRCVFRNAFDAHVHAGADWEFGSYGDTPSPTLAIQEAKAWANANRYENIWDDAFQIYPSAQGLKIHHNYFVGSCGISRDGSGLRSFQGERWPLIHHNIFNGNGECFMGREGRTEAGHEEGSEKYRPYNVLFTHGARTGYMYPWWLIHNTIIVPDTPNGGISGKSLMLFNTTQAGGDSVRNIAAAYPNLVINNIVYDNGQGSGAVGFRPFSGNRVFTAFPDDILDGNAYLMSRSGGNQRFQRITTSTGTTVPSTGVVPMLGFTLAQVRSGAILTDSQAYYPPGWDANSIEKLDRKLNQVIGSDHRPIDPDLFTGAIDLSIFSFLPKMGNFYEPQRGALLPLEAL